MRHGRLLGLLLLVIAHASFALDIGAAAPAFALPRADGAMLDSSALRGRVVLVDFWASWCAPCRKSFPALDALGKVGSSRVDLQACKLEYSIVSPK